MSNEISHSEPRMGRPRSLTLQQRIELRQMRGGGATLLECAHWFDTSRASISRYLAMPIPTADELRAELANPPQPKKPRKSALERRIDRFWAKVEHAHERGRCWLWKGFTRASGHGMTTWMGKPLHAHRLAWILKRGEITEGLCINHKCPNPHCCNPAHLYIGTREQNMADRWGYSRYRIQTSPSDTMSPSAETPK